MLSIVLLSRKFVGRVEPLARNDSNPIARLDLCQFASANGDVDIGAKP